MNGLSFMLGDPSDWLTDVSPGFFAGSKYTHSYESVYFKGAYSYYWPTSITGVDKMVEFEKKANAVLGSRLTPEVLWQLAPWSWLADWFGNVGDIISNATALSNDNLVIRYGYLMRKTQRMSVFTSYENQFLTGLRGAFTRSFAVEQKERVRATPFGFGLNTELFNPLQWSILAALGMTKSPRTLRQVS
jgi:hypothetical protein